MNIFYKLLLFLQKHGYYVCQRIADRLGMQYADKHSNHVCQRIADRLGMRAKVVRTSFMYLTFVTLGFGFALYLFLKSSFISVTEI